MPQTELRASGVLCSVFELDSAACRFARLYMRLFIRLADRLKLCVYVCVRIDGATTMSYTLQRYNTLCIMGGHR